jgi:lipopolysaccharide/colanic/teichoic acid biosynthesis glycosyltransferase
MDVRYFKTVSLFGDLWLMLQTAAVVVGRKGR